MIRNFDLNENKKDNKYDNVKSSKQKFCLNKSSLTRRANKK